MMPDNEAEIIEAMAEAYWRVQASDLADIMLATLIGVSKPGMRAALEASPLERYRAALEEIEAGLGPRMTLMRIAERALRPTDG